MAHLLADTIEPRASRPTDRLSWAPFRTLSTANCAPAVAAIAAEPLPHAAGRTARPPRTCDRRESARPEFATGRVRPPRTRPTRPACTGPRGNSPGECRWARGWPLCGCASARSPRRPRPDRRFGGLAEEGLGHPAC